MSHTAAAQHRITRLAAQPAVHRAFSWLHLHQPQLRQWLLEIVRIPAPPFGEAARAAWFLDKFQQLGLSNAHIDAEGNAVAELVHEGLEADASYVLISAHLDTVFPPETSCEPVEDESRILCPGACDNAAGLTALLGIAAALRFAGIQPRLPVLFVANVGEEGEGDLRGMRYLFLRGPYAGRIGSALILEGSGNTSVVTRSLGSRRFRITLHGPGGHAWADAGAPNPILLLGQLLSEFASLPLPNTPRTVLNVGHISGGTSVNSIPESASALLDLRSTDAEQLEAVAANIQQIVAGFYEKTRHQPLLEVIGDRPGAALDTNASILTTVHAVDRHLDLKTQPHIASTDANLPMSLHVQAVAVGAGGSGGGIHTLHEWYDPATREIALRRILLILLDIAS